MRGRCLVSGIAPLHDAHHDLLNGLRAHGWAIELALMSSAPAGASGRWERIDAHLSSPYRPVREAARLARRIRREMQFAPRTSAFFGEIEQAVHSRLFDVALVFTDLAPTGLARLFGRAPIPVLFVSLVSLAQELRYRRGLGALRAVARLASPLHPDTLRAIEPSRIRAAVFASRAWRDAAVAAGVPAHAAHVVHLGVPLPHAAPLPRTAVRSPARLLWAGRLSPEKGLHLFLDALPLVLEHTPVQLTVIASPGSAAYEREIRLRLDAAALRGIVSVKPAVTRAELIAECADYDLLLFHSVFDEPVAHVLLHAAAAGLGVVGPASRFERSLLREDQTATCYRAPTPAHISDAIRRALGDDDRRVRLARQMQREVRDDHDVATTIARVDDLLHQLVSEREDLAYA